MMSQVFKFYFRLFLICSSFTALLMIVPFAQAQETKIYPSHVCSAHTNLEGPTCCLETQEQCDQAAKLIPTAALQREELVRTAYFRGEFAMGRVPNCHWNAYSHLLGKASALAPVADYELTTQLSLNAIEIQAHEMRAGDVVIFVFVGKERVEPERPGGPWRWIESPETMEHSAVALSENLIFQKENIGSHVFSFGDLEQSRLAYEKAFTGGASRRRGQFEVRVFRPIQRLSRSTPF